MNSILKQHKSTMLAAEHHFELDHSNQFGVEHVLDMFWY